MSGRMMVAIAAVIAAVLVAGLTYGFAASLGPVEPEQLTVLRPSETPSPTPAPSASPSPSPSPTASPSPSPTATATPTPAQCTVVADADSWVDESPGATGTNHGTDTSLVVRSRDQNQNKDARSYLRFDLATCAIPPGATISSGTLRLHVTQPSNSPRILQVRKISAAWTETLITWDNQPAFSAAATDEQPSGIGPIDWDVSADVGAFHATPSSNQGWVVVDKVEGDGNDATKQNTFASREHATVANRPSLTITWTP